MAGSANGLTDNSSVLVYLLTENGEVTTLDDGTPATRCIERCYVETNGEVAADYSFALKPKENFPGHFEVVPIIAASMVESDDDVPSNAVACKDVKDKVMWTREAVLTLIDVYKDMESKMKSVKHKKKAVWLEIALLIEEKTGLKFTSGQAETKWKNVTKKYRDVVDHNNVSGNDRKTCPFYEELNEFYGHKPCVKPAATAAAGSFAVNSPVDEPHKSETASTGASTLRSHTIPKKRQHETSKSVMDGIKQMRDDVKAMECKRIELIEKIHKEKMEMFGAFLQVLKSNSGHET